MMSMPARSTYLHKEAFCLMKYVSDDRTEVEWLWNSRDGVTPFIIRSRSGKEMTHQDWRLDCCVPSHMPMIGDRIFVDVTQAIAERWARRTVERYWDDAKHPLREHEFATQEEAVAAFTAQYLEDPGQPAVIEVDADWILANVPVGCRHQIGRTAKERMALGPLGIRPAIVTLCGSTRFWKLFQQVGLERTVLGEIVLSIGSATGTDDTHFGNLPADEYAGLKERLDQLHLRKIELADAIIVLNQDDYIGDSTRRELAHARALGKAVYWWRWPSRHTLAGEAPLSTQPIGEEGEGE